MGAKKAFLLFREQRHIPAGSGMQLLHEVFRVRGCAGRLCGQDTDAFVINTKISAGSLKAAKRFGNLLDGLCRYGNPLSVSPLGVVERYAEALGEDSGQAAGSSRGDIRDGEADAIAV